MVKCALVSTPSPRNSISSFLKRSTKSLLTPGFRCRISCSVRNDLDGFFMSEVLLSVNEGDELLALHVISNQFVVFTYYFTQLTHLGVVLYP